MSIKSEDLLLEKTAKEHAMNAENFTAEFNKVVVKAFKDVADVANMKRFDDMYKFITDEVQPKAKQVQECLSITSETLNDVLANVKAIAGEDN